jgi:tagatose-1,6-bisphosphate aldolase
MKVTSRNGTRVYIVEADDRKTLKEAVEASAAAQIVIDEMVDLKAISGENLTPASVLALLDDKGVVCQPKPKSNQ